MCKHGMILLVAMYSWWIIASAGSVSRETECKASVVAEFKEEDVKCTCVNNYEIDFPCRCTENLARCFYIETDIVDIVGEGVMNVSCTGMKEDFSCSYNSTYRTNVNNEPDTSSATSKALKCKHVHQLEEKREEELRVENITTSTDNETAVFHEITKNMKEGTDAPSRMIRHLVDLGETAVSIEDLADSEKRVRRHFDFPAMRPYHVELRPYRPNQEEEKFDQSEEKESSGRVVREEEASADLQGGAETTMPNVPYTEPWVNLCTGATASCGYGQIS